MILLAKEQKIELNGEQFDLLPIQRDVTLFLDEHNEDFKEEIKEVRKALEKTKKRREERKKYEEVLLFYFYLIFLFCDLNY
jgi:hypothetical protein